MLRILLALDDYNELVYLQTVLKKMGFDVDGIQNQRKLEESLLSFNPQVIVATARGKRIDGVAMIADVARRASAPRLVLLRSTGQNIADSELDYPQVEQVLDSPVNIKQLILLLAALSSIDVEILMDKYQRIQGKGDESENEDMIDSLKESLGIADEPATSTPATKKEDSPSVQAIAPAPLASSSVSAAERTERFERALKEIDGMPGSVFDPGRVRAINKELRNQENIDELRDLEEERRAFVKSLFRESKED